jgi:hypothetical protein
MAFESRKKELEVDHMARYLAVKGGKELQQEEKYVKDHSVSDNAGQRTHLLLSRIKFCKPPHKKAYNKKKCGTGGKGRGEKAGCHNGGHPEVPARQTLVEESGYGMDAKGPGNGEIDQRCHPFGIMYALALRTQYVPPDKHIQYEISGQDDHIPEDDRIKLWIKKHIEDPYGLTQVHPKK